MSDRRDSRSSARPIKRRRLLQVCCGLALAPPTVVRADEGEDALAPPQENDLLVFAFGQRAGQTIAADDVVMGARQVLAYPMSPATQQARNATRLNQLIVVRVDPSLFAPETLARAADGIVAYSGVCTHTGCDVTDWHGDAHRFKCPCHESEFDPSDGARVVGGPAPWQLAALPLKIAGGALVVAGSFEGRVGFAQPGFDPFGGV